MENEAGVYVGLSIVEIVSSRESSVVLKLMEDVKSEYHLLTSVGWNHYISITAAANFVDILSIPVFCLYFSASDVRGKSCNSHHEAFLYHSLQLQKCVCCFGCGCMYSRVSSAFSWKCLSTRMCKRTVIFQLLPEGQVSSYPGFDCNRWQRCLWSLALTSLWDLFQLPYANAQTRARVKQSRSDPSSNVHVSAYAWHCLQEKQYLIHAHNREDNICGIVITDEEYPNRVAFTIISKVLLYWFPQLYSITVGTQAIEDFKNEYSPDTWTANTRCCFPLRYSHGWLDVAQRYTLSCAWRDDSKVPRPSRGRQYAQSAARTRWDQDRSRTVHFTT